MWDVDVRRNNPVIWTSIASDTEIIVKVKCTNNTSENSVSSVVSSVHTKFYTLSHTAFVNESSA
jgi:hypothetical protein